jgi:hypothetical protein
MNVTSQIRSATCVTLTFSPAKARLRLTLRRWKEIPPTGDADRVVVNGIGEVLNDRAEPATATPA